MNLDQFGIYDQKKVENIRRNLSKVTLKKCHTCKVAEGKLHKWGCEGERDPIDPLNGSLDFNREAKDVTLCKNKNYVIISGKKYKRVLHLDYCTLICPLCGEIAPVPGFGVSAREWKKIVPKFWLKKNICWDCYCQLYYIATKKYKSIAGVRFFLLPNQKDREKQFGESTEKALRKYLLLEDLADKLNF